MYYGNGEFPFQTCDILNGILLANLNAGRFDPDARTDLVFRGAQLPVAGMQISDAVSFQHQLRRLESAGSAHRNFGIAGWTDIKIRRGFAEDPFRIQVPAMSEIMNIAESNADQSFGMYLRTDFLEEIRGTFRSQGIAELFPLNQMFRQRAISLRQQQSPVEV